jgi:aminoglycoside phosphotransferase (APT) family kinase protein
VIGSDFVVMDFRQGVAIDSEIPPVMASHIDVSRQVGTAVVDALAELHRLGPCRQRPRRPRAARWLRCEAVGGVEATLERRSAGGRRSADGDSRRQAGSVDATLPRPSILHNDYKLDNCQFDPTPDRVKSIFDWDMATLGDPLVDLGTLLNYWPDPSDTDDNRPNVTAGMESMSLPGRHEMIERYAAQTGLDVSEVHWYEAFACWKRAVIIGAGAPAAHRRSVAYR